MEVSYVTLGQAKALGGVGSILALIGWFIGSPGSILGIIGWILVLFAVKRIADEMGKPKIFNDMLIAAVLLIIGIIVIGVVVVAVFLQYFGLGTTNLTPRTTVPTDFFALFYSILAGLVVAWAFFLTASVFIRRSYEAISGVTNVDMFRTSGLLFLIGAALTIILVGIIIVLIALVLQAIAFFSLPDRMQGPPIRRPSYMVPPAPPRP